jgi:hypothetical protein
MSTEKVSSVPTHVLSFPSIFANEIACSLDNVSKGGGESGTAMVFDDYDGEHPVQQHVRHFLPANVQRPKPNALWRPAAVVHGPLVVQRLPLVLRRQWHTWLPGGAAFAVDDVLPWAVSVQRMQRLPPDLKEIRLVLSVFSVLQFHHFNSA